MRPQQSLTVAMALILLAALTYGVLDQGIVHTVDWQLHLWVYEHLRGGVARFVAHAMALCGQRGVVLVPLVLSAIVAARKHRSVRPLLVVVGLLIGVAAGVTAFKVGVGRLAPSGGLDALHANGMSYPSGHAMNGLLCWALVLEFTASLGGRAARALPVRRRRVLAGVLGFTAGMGMTALDYHWLSDTIAGWLLGTALLICVLAVGPVHSRAGSKELKPEVGPAPAQPAPSA